MTDDLPPIGTRVWYRGAMKCALAAKGTVVAHRPRYPDPDDPRAIAPKSEWSLSIELEELPRDWPFPHRRLSARLDEIDVLPPRAAPGFRIRRQRGA